MQISIANAIGVDFVGLPNYITESFINRVIADGGSFEAPGCLFNTLTFLNNIA